MGHHTPQYFYIQSCPIFYFFLGFLGYNGLFLDNKQYSTYNSYLKRKSSNQYYNLGSSNYSKMTNSPPTLIVDITNINHTPNVFDLSYIIGPRLNAGSRIGNPELAT